MMYYIISYDISNYIYRLLSFIIMHNSIIIKLPECVVLIIFGKLMYAIAENHLA